MLGLFSHFELSLYDFRFRLRGPLSGLGANSCISKTAEIFQDNGDGVWQPGEPLEDLGNQYRNSNEPYEDCGLDQLCEGDEGYPGKDAGEKNGRWDSGEKFEDRGNGIRDAGQVVVLVEIDDESFRLIPEPYPYGRGTVWSQTLINLVDAGAKVVIFDLIFDNPDHQTLNLVSNLDNITGVDLTAENVLDGDKVFLEAMQYAAERGTAVILGAKRGYETNRYPYPDYLVAPSERLGWQANREDMPYSIGLVDHPDDADGVSRKYMMFTSFSDDPGTFIPSLAVQAVLEYTGSSNQTHWEFDAESLEFSIGQVKLKSYRRENAFLLNYWGPASSIYKTFNRYPLSDILDTEDYELAAEDSDIMDIYMFHPRLQPFRDKIVIVGSSLLEDHDFVITPFYSYAGSEILMPGMETHANAIQQIMSNDFITVPTGSLNYTSESGILHFIIIFIFTVITVFIGLKLNPFTSAMAATALVVLWLSISVGAFVTDWLWLPKWSLATLLSGFSWQWLESALTINVPDMNSSVMLPVVFPMASIIFAFGINLTYRLVTEHRDKSFLKQTFGTYISPELINQMYMEKRSPKLGGVQNYHSAFFADIQGFSTFSELLAPEDLVDLLNEYLTEMTNILLENNGTLDKYIGDAIVAFYGAPVAVPDHEYRVCLTAVQMQARLEELHEKWRSEADRWPEIVLHMRNRIGINSGPFVTGNMGSTMRMDYTMVGDSVNTAARLESSAKQYGVYIQVAESTYLKAGDSFVWRELDHVIVVGKNEALKVYELIGEIGNVPDVYDRLIPLFEEGLNAYKNQDWDKAIQLFTECDKMELMYPGRKTNPSRVYLKRCCDFLINPPEKNWDGVFRLTTK